MSAPKPMDDVLAWLLEHHPTLHADCEQDRSWLWITTNLQGAQNKATRESIKEYGFRFAGKGHVLPSGHIAHWGHSCESPIPFKRRGHKPSTSTTKPEPVEELSAEEAAFFS